MSKKTNCTPFLSDLNAWYRIYHRALGESLMRTNDPDFDPIYKDVFFGVLEEKNNGTPDDLEEYLYSYQAIIKKALWHQQRKKPRADYRAALKTYRQLTKNMNEENKL